MFSDSDTINPSSWPWGSPEDVGSTTGMQGSDNPAAIRRFFTPTDERNPLFSSSWRFVQDVNQGLLPANEQTLEEARQRGVLHLIRKPMGHVNEFLDLFDRPRQALAGGLYNLFRSTSPDDTFGKGLSEGWGGKVNTQSGYDLFGIPRPTDEDPLPSWALKAGGNFAANMATDPLMLGFAKAGAGMFGKAAKTLFPFLEAGETLPQNLINRTPIPQIAENLYLRSGLNKAVGHSFGEAQPIIDRARWGGNTTRRFAEDEVKRIAGLREETGFPAERNIDLMQGLERPQERPADIDPATWDWFTPLREKRQELFGRVNTAREAEGEIPRTNISTPDYDYTSHIFTGKKPAFMKGKPTIPDWSTADPQSRTLFHPVDAETGEEILPAVVTSTQSQYLKKLGIEGNKQTGFTFQGRPIEFKPQVSAKEIIDANIGIKPEQMLLEPEKVEAASINKLQKEAAFWESIPQMKEAGLLRKLEPTEEAAQTPEQVGLFDRIKSAMSGFTEPPQPRQVHVAGLDKYEADPYLADALENWAHPRVGLGNLFDPSTTLGQGLNLAGAGLHRANVWWKRNVLAALARGFADEMNRPQQLYTMAGTKVRDMPGLYVDSAKLRSRFFPDVFEGVPNKLLREGLEDRETMGPHMAGWASLAETGRMPSLTKQLFGNVPGGALIHKPAEWWGNVNDWVLSAIRKMEEQNKNVAVIDWLKRNEKATGESFGQLFARDPDEWQRTLDQGARFGHETMGDYSRMGTTPTEQLLIEADPFYRWHRYIIPAGFKAAVTQPQRLANLGRGFNTVFEPMSGEEYEKMPEWAKEQGMYRRFLGKTPDDWLSLLGAEPTEGKPRVFTAGRLNPFQHHAELILDAPRAVETKITPWLRGGRDIASNKNAFLGRDIDPIAGGVFQSMYNAATGQPYTAEYQRLFGIPNIPSGLGYLLSQSPVSRRLREWNELARGAAHSIDPETTMFQDPGKVPIGLPEALIEQATGRRPYVFDFEKNVRAEQWQQSKKLQQIDQALRWAEKQKDPEKIDLYRRMKNNYMTDHPEAMELVGPFPKKKKKE